VTRLDLDLGVGLALVPGLVDELEAVSDLVDCLEVEPQTFWTETGDPARPYRLAADLVEPVAGRYDAVLAHGVSAPVGGSRPPAPAVVTLFAETVDRLGAVLASEHLSFNQAEGPDGALGSAFLLPPRQTWAGVDAAVASVRAFRSALAPLGVPFSIETPVSYLAPRSDEIPDGAFVGAVAERADCGILLDLHNIWANERNGRQRALDHVAQLPLDRVWEVHLAGGFERRGYWLDAHSGGLEPGFVALAAEVLPRLPQLRAVVYEVMPEFVIAAGVGALREDLEAVHRMVEGARGGARRPRAVPAPGAGVVAAAARPAEAAGSPRVWEDSLAALALDRPPPGSDVADPGADGADADAGSGSDAGSGDLALVREVASDPGVELLRELVAAGRAGRVASSLPLTVRYLAASEGTDAVDALLAGYAVGNGPSLWGSEEGRRFGAWLAARTPSGSLVHATLCLDLAGIEAARTESSQIVELPVEPHALIAAVRSAGGPPDPASLPRGRYLVTVGAAPPGRRTA
jgi:uncharacterized protein (UPF0276 family)